MVGGRTDQAERALAIARELDDPALLARALTACGVVAGLKYNAEAAGTHYSEASVFARKLDDRWSLSQILAWRTNTGIAVGDPIAARAAGEEGRDLADAIGDRPNSRMCRAVPRVGATDGRRCGRGRRRIPGCDRRVRRGSRRISQTDQPDGSELLHCRTAATLMRHALPPTRRSRPLRVWTSTSRGWVTRRRPRRRWLQEM